MSICRLCTKSCPWNDVLGNRSFREKVSDVICMWVEINDTCLPRDVCKSCQERVDEFHSFKQQCRSFQLAFKDGKVKISTDASNVANKLMQDSDSIGNHNAVTRSSSKEAKISTENNSPSTENMRIMKPKRVSGESRVKKCTETVTIQTPEENTQKSTKRRRTSCVCELCGRAIYISRMDGHRNRHLGLEPYECVDCGDTFSCKYNMRLHWRRNHIQGEQSTCEICGKIFVSKMALRSHLNGVHCEKRFQCTICDGKFHTRYAWNIHLKIHNQKRDFKCALCRKSYYSKSVLNIHMRTHSGEAPFKCELCSTAYVYRNMYVAHMDKNHPGQPLMHLDGRRSFKHTFLNKIL